MEKIILELLINREAIVLFFILLILILVGVTIWNSKIEVKIENLDISTARKEIIRKDFEIYISIIAFNRITVFKKNAKKIKSKKINLGSVLETTRKIRQKTNKRALFKDLIISLKDFKFETKKADIKVEVGTEDAALTAILVGTIASFLGIILKGQKFKILPIYEDKNILNIKLDGIFRMNLIHYIYKTILKGREKNERKSSDRRAYAYSHE